MFTVSGDLIYLIKCHHYCSSIVEVSVLTAQCSHLTAIVPVNNTPHLAMILLAISGLAGLTLASVEVWRV